MTPYVREVHQQLMKVYGFPEDPKRPGAAMDVTDGEYPVILALRGEEVSDNVKVIGGHLYYCGFDPLHG